MAIAESITPEREHAPRRSLNPKWVVATVVLLIASLLAAPVWQIAQRRLLLREFKRLNCEVHYGEGPGPKWLRQWFSEELLDSFDPVHTIIFLGLPKTRETLDDSSIACVLGAPELKLLWIEDSKVGDAGMAHICRLQHLELLNLHGTNVSDLSIPLLSRMQSLSELVVIGSNITVEGGRKLEAALPGCVVIGPHTNREY